MTTSVISPCPKTGAAEFGMAGRRASWTILAHWWHDCRAGVWAEKTEGAVDYFEKMVSESDRKNKTHCFISISEK